VGSPLDHSRAGLLVISEAGLGGHKFCTKNAGTPCESVIRGHPTPNRQGTEFRVSQPTRLPRARGAGTYLIYHVDKGLGVVSAESSDHLDLIAIREDGCYQRGAITRGKGIAD
jgi:hypothetical protein